MSWAAHDFETYVIQRHMGIKVSFIGILVGTYTPDAFTKWYVYGVSKGPIDIGAAEPAQFHRGWPGAGFTHSILIMVVVAVLVLLLTKSKPWALGRAPRWPRAQRHGHQRHRRHDAALALLERKHLDRHLGLRR